MSTKIHTAYRIKLGNDPWSTLMDIRKAAADNAKRSLKKWYSILLKSTKTDKEFKAAVLDNSRLIWTERKLNDVAIYEYIRRMYAETLSRPEHNTFCLDVSITVRRHGRYWYLIPYTNGLLTHILDFLKIDPRLEEYGYWDNTDRPNHVSTREWNRRGKVWYKLTEDDIWQDMLVVDIVNFDGFWRFDPSIDLMRRELVKFRRSKSTLVS